MIIHKHYTGKARFYSWLRHGGRHAILHGMKTKVELRSELQQSRAELSVPEVIEKSERVLNALIAVLKNLKYRSLHCYEPIAKLHEVDVSELFDLPDAALFTSRKMNGEWHVISVIDDIAKNKPILDVIIVPMLGFDKTLHRIGYGSGYYDRFLADYPHALKIGVCYEQGYVDVVPAEPHDIPLNLIITEERAVISV